MKRDILLPNVLSRPRSRTTFATSAKARDTGPETVLYNRNTTRIQTTTMEATDQITPDLSMEQIEDDPSMEQTEDAHLWRVRIMTWNNNLPIDVPSIDKSKIDRNKEYSSCPSSSENSEKPLIPTNQRFPTTEKSYMLTDVTYHKEFEKPYTESYSPEKVYPEYYSPQKVYPEHFSPKIVYPEHYSPQIVYPEHYIPVNMLDSVMEGNESQDEDCYSVKDIEAGLKEESVPIENIYKDIDGGHNQTVPKACTEYIDSYIQL
ncbi:hypothetical protein FSP39_008643 [Pinctada imbricata]|uniref:Uncharacterized protein n=1 Tax=Pinctada imbricata TaxID=66713 RepID=A0AA88XQT8_PINIB|nr:hypothetical protein FSP39_008643 [Pinctada imbricata]